MGRRLESSQLEVPLPTTTLQASRGEEVRSTPGRRSLGGMEASWEEGEGGRNIPAFPLSLSDRQQCLQYVSPNLCIFGFLVSVLDKELTRKYLQTMTKI